jgi:hypothetical protein
MRCVKDKKIPVGVSLKTSIIQEIDLLRGPHISRSDFLERIVVEGLATLRKGDKIAAE